jgi:AAA domain
MLSLQEIAHILGGDVSGNQVLCPGPGHSKGDRSLAVKFDPADPNNPIVFSHAGDDPLTCKDYVRDRLGLPPFRGGNGHPAAPVSTTASTATASSPKIETIYDYLDENYELLFQVMRFTPKAFRQRRPDGKGGWEYKLDGVRRVLYQLPGLITAIAEGLTIYISEGEKAVDAALMLGIPATCSPHGAGKWRDEYSQYLKDASVIILPDNDEPGEKHQAMVRQSLADIATSAKVLRLPGLPAGGDIYDWIEGGGTKEQLLKLTDEAPIYQPDRPKESSTDWRAHTVSAAALIRMEFPPINYIVEGLCILAGRPKIGKSWLALDVCLGVSDEKDVLGNITPVTGDVLYCALEDTNRRLQHRITKLTWPPQAKWPAGETDPRYKVAQAR